VNTEALVAVIGSVVLAVLVRVSNMVCSWLARVLGVAPPDPIVPPGSAARSTPRPPDEPPRQP